MQYPPSLLDVHNHNGLNRPYLFSVPIAENLLVGITLNERMYEPNAQTPCEINITLNPRHGTGVAPITFLADCFSIPPRIDMNDSNSPGQPGSFNHGA